MSTLARAGIRIVLVALAAVVVLGCAAVGGPAPTLQPAPIVDCLATDAQTCASALSDARANAPAGTAPFRVRVTCSQPICLPGAGVAQVDVWYTDGSVDSYEMAWTDGPGAAPPPGEVPAEPVEEPILAIDPVCRGVEIGRCREMAKSIIVPVGQTGRVVSVVVTCTVARCTATDGQGTTRVAFEDGTIREADWAYAGP